MDTNEQTNSMKNSSALGEFSVLTPSQKHALEKEAEKKRKKNAADKAKRAAAALKRKQQEDRKKNARALLWILFLFICAAIGIGLVMGYKFLVHKIYGPDAMDSIGHAIGVFLVGGEFYWILIGIPAVFICKGIYNAFGLSK